MDLLDARLFTHISHLDTYFDVDIVGTDIADITAAVSDTPLAARAHAKLSESVVGTNIDAHVIGLWANIQYIQFKYISRDN